MKRCSNSKDGSIKPLYQRNCWTENIKLSVVFDIVFYSKEAVSFSELVIENIAIKFSGFEFWSLLFGLQVNKLTDIVKRLEARSSNKLKTLEENYFGSIQQINDLRRNMKTLNDEVALINARLSTGDLGPYDPQHQYKCRGTFVGHQAEIWCLITCGDILITGSSDKTIKVWNSLNCWSFSYLILPEG